MLEKANYIKSKPKKNCSINLETKLNESSLILIEYFKLLQRSVRGKMLDNFSFLEHILKLKEEYFASNGC